MKQTGNGRKKRFLWAPIYVTVLVLFTAYVLLDTFVIPRTYSVVPTPTGSQTASVTDTGSTITPDETTNATASVPLVSDTSYQDEHIRITLTQYRENDTDIYVADVQVTNVQYLKTAFASNTYGKNISAATSTTAKKCNALLAINGDFYGARTKGYVIRNGVLYRSNDVSNSQQVLVVWADGTMSVCTEGQYTAQELVNKGALQVFSFGPGLLANGTISVTKTEEVDQAMASNPRTAIGMIGNLHYVFVVSDGRTSQSNGLTLYQMATFLKGLGVTEAYNLDGGGSSTLYFNGKVINKPTADGTTFKERSVSDIVYIGY